MRYLGNKTRILDHIDQLISDKGINGGIFADLFTGTGSVGDHFKDRFTIVANDLMKCASIFAEAKLKFSSVPEFTQFKKVYKINPFDYFNTHDYSNETPGFITKNFSPLGDRKFFQEKNAVKIDFIRTKLDTFMNQKLVNKDEYTFLLASLLESVMGVSNTSGTYEAYFKEWEARSFKNFELAPLTINKVKLYDEKNKVYNLDSNELVRQIEGDIAYIDTPYTITQYASAYHVLETLALNDAPELIGKTGRRVARTMSDYSKRKAAIYAFEDLLRQLRFKHVIISYSNQSLIPLDDFVQLISKFALNREVEVRTIDFREYKNLNTSQKGNGNKLQEVLIYFKKDLEIIKSPLNYAGSKDSLMPEINASLPSHFSNFVDLLGGAFNVGANVIGTKKTYYNEKNPAVFDIINVFIAESDTTVISRIKSIIEKFHLKKSDKEAYLKLRSHYNSVDYTKRDPLELFVLTLYSFQHMIRFNKSGEYNVPVGNSGLTDDVLYRIKEFKTRMPLGTFFNCSFTDINIQNFDKDTLFYFDPPYIITSAAYNDGKRLESEWTEKEEIQLLNYLDKINENGQMFLLSNVIKHNGKKNELLIEWIKQRCYSIKVIGTGGKRYPRVEVVIFNY